jgi:hypothetical protein
MVKQQSKLLNQILAHIHFDKEDKTVVRISFDNVIKILADNDVIVPQKIYETTLEKVLEERLVGKAQVADGTKWIIAQAVLNTALLLAVSKYEIIAHKIRTNQA